MATRGAALKLTYAELAKLPDDGLRHELIDGDHIVSPSPMLRHQVIAGRLFAKLMSFVDDHAAGQVFIAPSDVVLSQFDVVVPDLLFVSSGHESILTAMNVQGAPDLVVEVLSPSNRRIDEVRKLRLYERTGVREYWLVDPQLNSIEIYRREGGGFGQPIELAAAAGECLTTDLLPSFSIPLVEIFRPAGAPLPQAGSH